MNRVNLRFNQQIEDSFVTNAFARLPYQYLRWAVGEVSVAVDTLGNDGRLSG